MARHAAPRHHRGTHRAPRRRRKGVLGGLAASSLLVAATALGLVLQPGSPPASANVAGVARLESAQLAPVRAPRPTTLEPARPEAALPAGSGSGRRIVFSQTAQRVWLVGADGDVARTYAVSGSLSDNLAPGRYRVHSRTRHATAFDASGTMDYFVRFATGRHAPIGFHAVPIDRGGRAEQTKDQLGTPQSAGCVRAWRDDAKALWDFAPVGTRVVVI